MGMWVVMDLGVGRVGGPGVLAGGGQREEEMQPEEEGGSAPSGVPGGHHPGPVGLCGGMP